MFSHTYPIQLFHAHEPRCWKLPAFFLFSHCYSCSLNLSFSTQLIRIALSRTLLFASNIRMPLCLPSTSFLTKLPSFMQLETRSANRCSMICVCCASFCCATLWRSWNTRWSTSWRCAGAVAFYDASSSASVRFCVVRRRSSLVVICGTHRVMMLIRQWVEVPLCTRCGAKNWRTVLTHFVSAFWLVMEASLLHRCSFAHQHHRHPGVRQCH